VVAIQPPLPSGRIVVVCANAAVLRHVKIRTKSIGLVMTVLPLFVDMTGASTAAGAAPAASPFHGHDEVHGLEADLHNLIHTETSEGFLLYATVPPAPRRKEASHIA
jgi:hypothetical protein